LRNFTLEPSLKINDEGIEVTPSLLPCKPITLAWVEIAAISFGKGRSKVSLAAFLTILQSFSYLSIDLVPEYEKLILARQPFFNKAFFKGAIQICQWLFLFLACFCPFHRKDSWHSLRTAMQHSLNNIVSPLKMKESKWFLSFVRIAGSAEKHEQW
jgi:hypothetical protein